MPKLVVRQVQVVFRLHVPGPPDHFDPQPKEVPVFSQACEAPSRGDMVSPPWAVVCSLSAWREGAQVPLDYEVVDRRMVYGDPDGEPVVVSPIAVVVIVQITPLKGTRTAPAP